MPDFDGRSDPVRLMSAGDPLGALVSISREPWDARTGHSGPERWSQMIGDETRWDAARTELSRASS